MPIEPNSGQYVSFTVVLSALSAVYGNGTTTTISDQDIPVVLDTGTSITYLPANVASPMFSALDAYDDSDNSGLIFVDCNYLTTDPAFTFAFQFGSSDGPTINVGINQFILNEAQALIAQGLVPPPDLPFPADQACLFGIAPTNDIYILGDTFLRAAYVVYDLENHEIALAQTNFNSTETHIVEIVSGIPDVSGVASQVTVAQTATGAGSSSSQVTGTASTSAAGMRLPAADFKAVVIVAVAGIFALLGSPTL